MAAQEIKFQLQGIEIMDVNIKHPQKQLALEVRYNFDINLQQTVLGSDKLIIVSPAVTITTESDKDVYGFVRVNFIYKVENLDEMKIKDSDKYDIPDSFVTTLNSISLSTTRGIMFSHFKGTFLHNTILPIVNPTDFKKEEL